VYRTQVRNPRFCASSKFDWRGSELFALCNGIQCRYCVDWERKTTKQPKFPVLFMNDIILYFSIFNFGRIVFTFIWEGVIQFY